MTIAVGVLATDGIVLAADTQLTAPSIGWKGEGGKIMARAHRSATGPRGACAITGATTIYEYLHGLGDHIWKDFDQSITDTDKDAAYVRFQQIVYDFNEQHVIPWQPDRPDINVLIAYQREGKTALWQSNRGLLIEQYDHAAVGIGSLAASAWLGRVWKQGLDVPTAVVVAAFAAAVAKESVDGCGKYTNVLVVQADAWRRINQKVVNEIDRLYESWASEIHPAMLLDCLGETRTKPSVSFDEFKGGIGSVITKLRESTPEYVKQWRADRWAALKAKRDPQSTTESSPIQPPSPE